LRRLTHLPLLLTAALLFLFVFPSAAKTPVERSARTESPVENFTMNGLLAAYSTDTPGLRILTWNVLTGRKKLMSGIRTQDESLQIAGLAVAGNRVAWISASAGNTEYNEHLFTSSLAKPKERLLAGSQRFASGECPGDPRCVYGTWIHGLVGTGRLFAVSRWTTEVKGGVESVSNERLNTIESSGLHQLVSGPGAIVAQSADSGRIAVLRPAGIIDESQRYSGSSIGIYDARGRLVRELLPPASDLVRAGQGRMVEVVLSGDYLGVLTVRSRLKLYNWRSGKLLHNWRLPPGAGHLDIYGQLATYLVTHSTTSLTLHLRQLQTGRDVIFRRLSQPPATLGFVGVAIEKPGLAYAWDGCKGQDCYGNLRFVPMARVLAGVSKGHVR
jgi:hypothetical protein